MKTITVHQIGFAKNNNWVLVAEATTPEIAKKKLAYKMSKMTDEEINQIKNNRLILTSYEKAA